jgi:hypothetical protein
MNTKILIERVGLAMAMAVATCGWAYLAADVLGKLINHTLS